MRETSPYPFPFQNDTTVVTPGAGPEAQLLLLQLLTQLKTQQDMPPKYSNECSPGEEALRALARESIAQEEETKRQLEELQRSTAEREVIISTELRDLNEQLQQSQAHNLELEISLQRNENEQKELLRKIEEIEGNRAKELQEVLQGRSSTKALIEAAKTGNIAHMTIILDSGIDLEFGDENGWTPLEWTIAFGHTQACRLLLERGANPNNRIMNPFYFVTPEYHSNEEQWPLKLAARFGQLDIASLLLQFGADISDDEPEMWAKYRGYLELAQLLCEWRGMGGCSYLRENKFSEFFSEHEP